MTTAGVRRRPAHAVCVWARDWPTTAWAWACTCGTRYLKRLTSLTAAQTEARAHLDATRTTTTTHANQKPGDQQ